MSNPTVTVRNNSSRPLFIAKDPNWDDMVLMVDGKDQDKSYTLTKGGSCTISVAWDGSGDEEMLGAMISEAANYDGKNVGVYEVAIGQDPQTGNLNVTDSNPMGDLHVRFSVGDATPWAATMTFQDK